MPGKKESRRRQRENKKDKLRGKTERELGSGRLQGKNKCTDWRAELADALQGGEAPDNDTPNPMHKLRAAAPQWDAFATEQVKSLLREGSDPEMSWRVLLRPRSTTGWPIPAFELPECPLTEQEHSFLQREIPSYVHKGILTRVRREELHNVSPLFTLDKDGAVDAQGRPAKRLLCDLTRVNCYLETKQFTMQQIRQSLADVSEGCYFVQIDVKSAFFSIGLTDRAARLFGTSFTPRDASGKTLPKQCHRHNVMVQGASSSPQHWAVLFGELVQHLRKTLGIKLTAYADDGLVCVPGDMATAVRVGELLIASLDRFGMTVSKAKSFPARPPSKQVDHMGFNMCSETMSVGIKESRRFKMQQHMADLVKAATWSAREAQSITGKLMSNLVVLENTAFKRTRSLNRFLGDNTNAKDPGKDLDKQHPACTDAALESQFWVKHLATDPRKCLRPRKKYCHSRVGAVDASDRGLGGVLLGEDGEVEVTSAASLTTEEMAESSTLRELLGVIHFLQTNRRALKRKTVTVLTDNRAVPRVNRHGSKKRKLHEASLLVDDITRTQEIELKLVWIPRRLNEGSDAASRLWRHDTSDECLSKRAYGITCKLAGTTPTFDTFASTANHKCKRFGAMFAGPGVTTVNSVLNHPEDTNLYAFPPFIEVEGFLDRIKKRNKTATQTALLVLPGGRYMHHSIRARLMRPGGTGYAVGVRRIAKIRNAEISLGPVGRHSVWQRKDCDAEVFLIGMNFRS